MKPPIVQDIKELTSIRAFAALMVVVLHMFFVEGAPSSIVRNIVADGHLGVDLFFMLSGFILAHVYLSQWRAGTFNYATFLVNRLARVYPLHLFMVLMVLLAYVGASAVGLGGAAEGKNWSHLPWHLLLMHAWGTTDSHSWNFPSWSVSAEAFAYILFPVVLLAVARLNALFTLAVSLVLFGAASLWVVQVMETEITKIMFNFGIIRVFFEFLIGVALYLVFERHRVPAAWVRPLLWVCILGCMALAAIQFDERVIVLGLGAMLFLLAHLSVEERPNVLRHPVLVYLGEISYATYMVHILVLFVGKPVRIRLGLEEGLGRVVISLVLIAVIYAASALLHHVIERPGRKLIRNAYVRKRALSS
jgi:peptidoglycan/LPS O-acetylase OafA/YrhL